MCADARAAGECKSVMTQYLRCIRAHKGTNDDECRQISKAYLQCRMERYVHMCAAYISHSTPWLAAMPDLIRR